MSSLWFAFTTHKNTREYFQFYCCLLLNLTILFVGQFYFRDSFQTQGLYMYGCRFVKSGKYSSSEVSIFSVPLFPFFEALFISSDFGIFILKLVWSSSFFLSFVGLLDIFWKKAPSTIIFLNAITSMIRKRLETFSVLRNIFNEDVFKGIRIFSPWTTAPRTIALPPHHGILPAQLLPWTITSE